MSISITGASTATALPGRVTDQIAPIQQMMATPVVVAQPQSKANLLIQSIATTPVSTAARLLSEITGTLARIQAGKSKIATPTVVTAPVATPVVAAAAKPVVATVAAAPVITPPSAPVLATVSAPPPPVYVATIATAVTSAVNDIPPPAPSVAAAVSALVRADPAPAPSPEPDTKQADAPQPAPEPAPAPAPATEPVASGPAPQAAPSPAVSDTTPAATRPKRSKTTMAATPASGAVPRGTSGVSQRSAGISMRDLYRERVGTRVDTSALPGIAAEQRFTTASSSASRADILAEAAYAMVARAQINRDKRAGYQES